MGDKNMSGIIPLIGRLIDKEENHLICTQGLKTLCTFLDFEQNREAEAYIRIFAELSINQLKTLNFKSHLSGPIQKPCKQYALKLLNIFVNRNPNLSDASLLSLLNNS